MSPKSRILNLLKALLFSFFAMIAASGCSSKAVKDPPALWNGSKFLQHAAEMREQAETAPFRWIWVNNEGEIARLLVTNKNLNLPPVDLQALQTAESATKGGTETFSLIEDAQVLASFFHDKIKDSFISDKRLAFQIVDAPGAGTFVLESAIIDLEPTLAVINAAASIAGFFIPGAILLNKAISTGTSAAAEAASRGRCAVAFRIRNGETDAILLEAADRQSDSSALLLDMKNFSQYGHTREALTLWAKNLPWLFDRSQAVKKKSSLAVLSLW